MMLSTAAAVPLATAMCRGLQTANIHDVTHHSRLTTACTACSATTSLKHAYFYDAPPRVSASTEHCTRLAMLRVFTSTSLMLILDPPQANSTCVRHWPHRPGFITDLAQITSAETHTCHRYINGTFTAEPTSQCNGYN